MQTALEALSNLNVGDVTVTGGALPGTAVTVTFGGARTGVNVPQMTASSSLTGGTAPALPVTTGTAGGGSGSDGTETLVGFLLTPVAAPTVNTIDPVGALLDHGKVVSANLPIAVDAAGQADVAGRIQFV